MAYDIYGNNLRSGHCEVHPSVHEEYPCSLCLAHNQQSRQQPDYDRVGQLEYYLGQARQEIDRLTAEATDYKNAAIKAESILIDLQERVLEFMEDVRFEIECPCGEDDCSCLSEHDCNCVHCRSKTIVSGESDHD